MTFHRHIALGAGLAAAMASTVAGRQAEPPLAFDPASYVDTRIGTANGGNTFPGAVLPFGMLAWSPEEIRPDPQRGPLAMRAAAAGGYQYDTTRVRGFSLTHLSGTGCRGASGDIPFMPVTVPVTTSPSADVRNEMFGADFDHANETGAAGYYRVKLASGVDVELTAALRAGIGRFTYPQGQPAAMLVRTSDSQVGSSEARVDVDRAARVISGSVTSGNFCGYLGTVNRRSYYTLYFAAAFDQPFTSTGTWKNQAVSAGSTTTAGGTTYGTDGYPAPGVGSGAYATFEPGSVVHVRVAVSYVSLANARANLDAEVPAQVAFDAVKARAHDAWNAWLRRIEIGGGTEAERRIFYTALYHASLHLNLASDVTGEYAGFDGRAHKVVAPQRAQYANFSGWDVYRSQLMLVALLDPTLAGEMAQSLLNQADQNQGEWDRWTHNTGATHVMEGDAAAQSVPSIVAFGGTNFDMPAAFASLYRAATVPTANDLSREGCNVACPGQRPSLDKWLTIHYIPTQSNAWGGAGETLEDVTADFALSEFARRLGRTREAGELRARSGYWRNIFNPNATPERGYIQNRNEDGTWPRFTPSSSSGFAEGSSAVYTWMIPFDVQGLFDAMGGVEPASARLDEFFHLPDGTLAVTGAGGLHAEMNNEPSIGTPWLYAFAGRADKTQQVIRETIKVLWKDTPRGIPGNDDLGAMSAWFVWAAMGMHPLAPGRAELVLASPLFPRIVVHRANGKTIRVSAPGANLDTFYVQSLRVNGRASSRAWLPESFVSDGGTLDYGLGTTPNPRWAGAPVNLPPSFGPTTGQTAASALPRGPVDRAEMAARVKAEFLHAWNNYIRLASGHDELNPISATARDWYPPAVVYMTPVDALDTMLLMGLRDEAQAAQEQVLHDLSFDRDVSVQVFEVNIRLLGGLISAYQMTGTPRYLTLAEDLGRRLLPAFRTPTGMPYRFVNLVTGKTDDPVSNPAEIGTLILEFGTLSRLTKNDVYYDTAKKALVELTRRRDPTTGLLGEAIDVTTGRWTNPSSHIGGGIDSYYEYVLKCQRLFGDADCGTMWKDGVAAVNRYLADDRTDGLWYGVADMKTGRRTQTIYGALHAFLPAVLAMGGDVSRAARLQDSGFRMWTLYGIEPEELDYAKMQAVSEGYQLRPEIIESAYYLYHYTKDPKYLEMGREFFEDIVRYCRTANGYTTLRSVVTKEQGDRQHSFLLAETFKYLYLLFAPDALDFDTTTFNTEAHPLRRTW